MQIYLLDRLEADVFVHALTCTGLKQSCYVMSDLIGWEFARHTGKRHRFAFTNSTMPQLIKVLTFPNGL